VHPSNIPKVLDELEKIISEAGKSPAPDEFPDQVRPDRGFEKVPVKEFSESRSKSDRQWFLTQHGPEKLSNFRTYKMPGEDVGYALTPEGDLVNVFNASDIKGAGTLAVVDAIANGAKTLDCFNTKLVDYYKRFGFEEVKREPWDERFRPENWPVSEGTPDVVYLKYGGTRDPAKILQTYERNRRLQEGERNQPSSQAPGTSVKPDSRGRFQAYGNKDSGNAQSIGLPSLLNREAGAARGIRLDNPASESSSGRVGDIKEGNIAPNRPSRPQSSSLQDIFNGSGSTAPLWLINLIGPPRPKSPEDPLSSFLQGLSGDSRSAGHSWLLNLLGPQPQKSPYEQLIDDLLGRPASPFGYAEPDQLSSLMQWFAPSGRQ
jgi:hypothetical protein